MRSLLKEYTVGGAKLYFVDGRLKNEIRELNASPVRDEFLNALKWGDENAVRRAFQAVYTSGAWKEGSHG